ncbi:multifunctional CCA addition/repair protein [Thalassotalea euphylliae]|uniref:Multifunctional CCA protein n=1 Tax=Thalassotalea euphylliae TaxID=1655234 RepID=A0A3E0TTG1_9GAMM|nr:multifunctional CCA addition/repair protein [Thalassotalea euphylliae]REL27971.1 multifunctional CCA addition/repair protein [Thalassotalea euphylliae]
MAKQLADLNVFLVGGAVRDQLLERDIVERDYMVVGATQQQMLNLGFQQVGKDFPVFLHPETKDEYALARTERKQGQGYTGFVCYAEPDVTLEQDLIRRDLTVNAMAMAPNGEIIDPYGGQQDLADRILRHVSPAFSEDPLRVLRVARFAARYHQYGFTIAADTLALMSEIAASGELVALSAERVWKEIDRALAEPNPEVFIDALRACGALKALWPELDKLWGIPNPAQHHPEICSGIHTLLVLQQAVKLSNDPKVRFAALCHDLGKGLTPAEKWPKHYGHEQAGVAVIEQVAARLKVPNDYKLLAVKVSQFHLNVHRAFELKPSTVLRILEQCEYQRKPELFNDILLVCQADSLGRLGAEHNDYPQAAYLTELANLCRQVSAKPFVAQGLQGKAIKEAMNKAKLLSISQYKADYICPE